MAGAVGTQTTETVRHKYGDEAAEATDKTVTAAGATLTSYRQVSARARVGGGG